MASSAEIGEGLVEQEDVGLTDEHAAHRHPLALTAGELGGPAVQQLLQAQHLGHLLDAPGDVTLGHPAPAQRIGEVARHRHVRVQGVVLEDHRDVQRSRIN
jgi:hypothetical protein